MAQVRLARVIPSMHVHLCVALWLISLHPSPVFYFVPPFSFQPFLMFTSEFNERFRSNPCATCAWGPWPPLTTRHPSQFGSPRPGHLLVRHNKGLRCKVRNVYRADRQFRFWSRHPCFPRPIAAVVISQFRNKKRQHINTSAGNSCPVPSQSGERSETYSKHDEKEFYHCTSLGGQDIQCTHSHLDHLPLLVSLEPEDDLAHTHQCCDYSISQAAEESGESQHVLTKLHVCGMEGKRRKIASFADPGGPRAPLRSNFDDPEGWDTSGSEEECVQRDVVHRMAPCCLSPNHQVW